MDLAASYKTARATPPRPRSLFSRRRYQVEGSSGPVCRTAVSALSAQTPNDPLKYCPGGTEFDGQECVFRSYRVCADGFVLDLDLNVCILEDTDSIECPRLPSLHTYKNGVCAVSDAFQMLVRRTSSQGAKVVIFSTKLGQCIQYHDPPTCSGRVPSGFLLPSGKCATLETPQCQGNSVFVNEHKSFTVRDRSRVPP